MNNWPKGIVVGGATYAIEYAPYQDGLDTQGENSNLWGQVNYRKHLIRIWTGNNDTKQEPSECLDTLLHELLHIVFEQNPAMGKLLVNSDDAEVIITCLARTLTDTLVRNKVILLPAGEV